MSRPASLCPAAGKLSNEAPDGSIIPDEIYQAMLAAAGTAGTAEQALAPPPKGIASILRVTHGPKPAPAGAPGCRFLFSTPSIDYAIQLGSTSNCHQSHPTLISHFPMITCA